jgi:hypothetical protein
LAIASETSGNRPRAPVWKTSGSSQGAFAALRYSRFGLFLAATDAIRMFAETLQSG